MTICIEKKGRWASTGKLQEENNETPFQRRLNLQHSVVDRLYVKKLDLVTRMI